MPHTRLKINSRVYYTFSSHFQVFVAYCILYLKEAALGHLCSNYCAWLWSHCSFNLMQQYLYFSTCSTLLFCILICISWVSCFLLITMNLVSLTFLFRLYSLTLFNNISGSANDNVPSHYQNC